MTSTSRNTVKKYITHWRTLGISYEDFQSRSDAQLHTLFCAKEESAPNPGMTELEERLPYIVKNLRKKGMTTFKQWQEYIKECPYGYGLTQFRISVQRYRMINNPSMRMEHKAGDKMFIDYTGTSYGFIHMANNRERWRFLSPFWGVAYSLMSKHLAVRVKKTLLQLTRMLFIITEAYHKLLFLTT